jgi:hypothetical protein
VILISDVIIFLTYRSSKNPRAKKRVGFFVIGYTTIIFGYALFLIDGILDSFITLTPYLFPSLVLVVWLAAPILMLVGFNVKTETESTSFANKLKTESQLLKAKHEQQKSERPS